MDKLGTINVKTLALSQMSNTMLNANPWLGLGPLEGRTSPYAQLLLH